MTATNSRAMPNDNGSTQFELYRYSPSLVGAVIFIALFAMVSFLHTYQLVRTRTWYFIPFCIGGYCMFVPLTNAWDLELTFSRQLNGSGILV